MMRNVEFSEFSCRPAPALPRSLRQASNGVPNETPCARHPWHTLAGLLIGSYALLIGLECGGQHAVAAELFSPKQRTRQLAQAENEEARPKTVETRPAAKFHVSGEVRMADGSALPPNTDGFALVINRTSMGTGDLPLDGKGRFNKEFSAQAVYLAIRSPNLPMTYSGPYSADAQDIDLLLDEGFSTRVRFVNEAGDGVPGVVLEQMGYAFRGGSGYMGHPHPQQGHTPESDGEGYVTINGCAHWPITIDVRSRGYQFERQEHPLQPDATFVWKLKRAVAATGTVLDDASGKPIAGADLLLAARAGYADLSQYPRGSFTTAPRLAVSDGKGHFDLGSLRDDCRYAVFVRTGEHAVGLLSDVRAGHRDMIARLGRPLHVTGRITGNLDRLRLDSQKQTRYLQYRNELRWSFGGFDDLLRADVRIENGVGRFTVTDLLPGPVTLEFPRHTVSLNVTEPTDDFEIELD